MNLLEQNKKIMKKYNISAQKKFGQNFLINENVLDEIIEMAQIDKNDIVIEIGPGTGNLTKKMCEKADKVIAIEIDSAMINVLRNECSTLENLEIINQDIMKTDLKEIISKYENKKIKVVANLPYYITTPIVMKLLEERLRIDLIEVMVQKEVAERICAKNGNKTYGAITVAINYYTNPVYLFDVKAENFLPAPEVDSAVVRLDVVNRKIENEEMLFKIIKAAFSQRRKTLMNSLGNAQVNGIDKEFLRGIMAGVGMDNNIRAEQLSLDDYIKLAEEYVKCI